MTFDIDAGGRVRRVVVEPVASVDGGRSRFRVTVHAAGTHASDRESVVVEAVRTELGLSLVYVANGRQVDIALTPRLAGEVLAQLPHVDVPILVDAPRAQGVAGGANASGTDRISAPMPGRIIRVLVKAGDEIVLGQPVVVIEAMKMENELKALRAGRVRDVHVSEASSVEAGRLLVTLE